ncbi:alpha-L-rhamnosidase [Flavilitoribacter nigricans]|uniref:alpha-L-rhamnosidase n=1 Tax=Flavilitoribacter nigricans (strain ATCC 23147 / DSM 23189 / NBRC 102662 / NCIMB 1420 / SS-2) TaxID=1122177 RepID=A0A2D0N1L2_FLAN2|nr:alpha-L-rhamnosidase [Flavilitoribacter nigricans]PHN02385.1 alpha-L-rhamnosidase [Flavilitoribacter nigricans DSM 23189 = NBRC 102662]
MRIILLISGYLLLVVFPLQLQSASLQPHQLRCEYLPEPLAMEKPHPRLSWQLEATDRGAIQTAYQILVASTPELLGQDRGDLWDSGKVPSNRTNQIHYAGHELAARQDCYWKVRVWGKEGTASSWSEPAYWKMGLLDPADWKAQWIGFDNRRLNKNETFHLPPSPYFRKSWQAKGKVKKAILYSTALGLYEARINGQKVGKDYFAPGWTDYDQRVYYQTYDVTSMLRTGGNAIGFILANGWYAGYTGYAVLVGHPKEYAFYGEVPVFMAQLEIEYENGEREMITSDTDWKVNTGPTLEADLLMGEAYDARLEFEGWDESGYDDASWRNCRRMVGAMGKVESSPGVPVQIVEEIEPIAISEPEKGKYIFDLGTNIAGIVQLKIRGKAGTRVQLRYGEMLHPDGRLMTENLRKARATDTYILKGDSGGESWSPKFTYHGFQYVEVSGLDNPPDKEMITGLVLSSVTPRVGHFESGNDMINQLYRNIVRTQKANYLDVPTDCPQRDERMGWTGDAQIYIRTATYNSDIAAFHQKWLVDLNDAQFGNGAYPNFAPMAFHRPNMTYSPGWMDAGIICTYNIFKVYDDLDLVRKFYSNMQEQLNLYQRKSEQDLLQEGAFDEVDPQGGFGDWLNQDKTATSKILAANIYWLFDLKLMAEMADAIGQRTDAENYRITFRKVQEAFLEKYRTPEGRLQENTQTACVMALDLDVLPTSMKPVVARQLVQLLEENNGYLTTGFLGAKHLLPVLSNAGYRKEALELFTKKGFPSWLYEVVNGATSIWERWDSYTIENGFGGAQNTGMNSFSHYAFGAVAEWMFRHLAGIDMMENGFREIAIRPEPNRALGPVAASYQSINGEIRSAWSLSGNDLKLEVTIPANTTAQVWIPARAVDAVKEGGLPLTEAKGILGQEMDGQLLRVKIGSGTYTFTSASVAGLLPEVAAP